MKNTGKSILLRIVGVLEIPTEGEIRLSGKALEEMDIRELIALRFNTVGFIYQDFQLLPQLTALENVMIPLIPSMKYNKARGRAEESLEDVGLTSRMNHKPFQLSGGEQQRVAIARALTREPKLLLADEPTENLDTNTRDQIMEVFDELNNQGLSIIVATHDIDIVSHCKDNIRLRDGQIVE